MAIADLLYYENIPDRVADSPRLRRVLDLARMSSSDFNPPGRKKVGNELLQLAHNNVTDLTKKELVNEAVIWGLTFSQ